jgi:hypothetical protein
MKIKAGPNIVLSMRRGRIYEERKKKINKYLCRKSKGGKKYE